MKRRMLEILNAVKKKVLKTQGGVDCGLAIPWLLFVVRPDDVTSLPSSRPLSTDLVICKSTQARKDIQRQHNGVPWLGLGWTWPGAAENFKKFCMIASSLWSQRTYTISAEMINIDRILINGQYLLKKQHSLAARIKLWINYLGYNYAVNVSVNKVQ